MVLTTAQTQGFFENANQMNILHATSLQISNEVIVTVCKLSDFDKDTFGQIADNLRQLGGRVANTAVNAMVGATIPTPPCIFGPSPNIIYALSMTL